jgi:hypothetical protein
MDFFSGHVYDFCMMLIMVKEADRNRVEVPGDYEVLDPTEDHDVVQWTLL